MNDKLNPSPTGVGAVLMQVEEGIEKPIAFASKKLSKAESNYSQLDREALSIVFGVKKFEMYLLGRKFELRTDHKPLLGLFSNEKQISPNANARIIRWSLILSQFDYNLVFKSGKENVIADCLSRLPVEDNIEMKTPAEYINLINIDFGNLSFDEIKKCTKEDVDLLELRKYIKFGFPNNAGRITKYAVYRNDLSLHKDVILFKNRILIPPKLQSHVLNMLYAAHNGIVAMKEEARGYVWWPHMNSDIENLTKSCSICYKNVKPNKEPILSWPIPNRPWSRLHIDYCGPFENKYLLVVIDATSKFIDIHAVNSTTSATTIEMLRKTFANFGIPDVIVSDNAQYFVSTEMKNFYDKNGIKLVNPAPYNPSSNGLAERAVQTVKNGLNKFKNGSLGTRIARFLYNYRSSVHSTLKRTPAEVLFKRKFKTRLDILKPFDEEREMESNKSSGDFCDFDNKSFEIGEAVFAKNFNSNTTKKWLPGKVVEVLGFKNYKVKVYDFGEFVWKRHCSQLIPRQLPIVDVEGQDNTEIYFILQH